MIPRDKKRTRSNSLSSFSKKGRWLIALCCSSFCCSPSPSLRSFPHLLLPFLPILFRCVYYWVYSLCDSWGLIFVIFGFLSSRVPSKLCQSLCCTLRGCTANNPWPSFPKYWLLHAVLQHPDPRKIFWQVGCDIISFVSVLAGINVY